jgi:uncharacterized iron-regulated membrane protein
MTKIGLRNIWFQVHKWLGLLLAILILPLCVSGAALVWHDAVDKALNPSRYAVTAAEPSLPPAAYVAAAQGVLVPGETIANIRFETGTPVIVSAARLTTGATQGRPVRTMIWLDPGSGRVLDKARSDAGFVRVMHNLHGNLLLPGIGRTIVGILGFAMLFSCVSGLWLWWPTVGSWLRGLRWGRHSNLDTNLHHMMGFWIALPLFVLSLTGAWISFPALFGGRPVDAAARMARMRAQPLEHPVQSLSAVLAKAESAASAHLVSIDWPTDRDGHWKLAFKRQGAPVTFAVSDATGSVELGKQTAPPVDPTARLMRRIHDGEDMGLAWQVVIFLGGILPAVLSVTGIIMWWRARQWRKSLADRQQAKAIA